MTDMSRRSAPLKLPAAARRALEERAQARDLPLQEIRRARALLLAADGMTNVEVARLCGVSPRTVAAWRDRFAAAGVDALRWSRRGLVPPPDLPDDLLDQVLDRPPDALYRDPGQRAAVVATTAAAPRHPRPLVAEVAAESHRHFLSFLKTVDRGADRDEDVVLLVDRWPGHLGRFEVDRWLSNPKRGRFRLHAAASSVIWDALAGPRIGPIEQEGSPT